MKQYSSRLLKSIAQFYLFFPISHLVFIGLLFDVPGSSCLRILLSPYYILLCVIAIFAGYGLHEMRKWGWYVFVIANVLIGYSNAVFIQDYGTSNHKVVVFILSILILLFVMYRVAREVRVPYFFPKIRWWESNPRYRLSVPVKIVRNVQNTLDGEILDISMGGCFVKLRSEASQDEMILIKFKVFGVELDCQGIVVWRTGSTVTHPKGVGIKFVNITKDTKRALKVVTRRLKKIALLYRTSRYMLNQEEFMKKLEELESPENVKIG